MSDRHRRNIGMHTDAATMERRILAALERGECLTSGLGYAAFEGYDFRNPQGAALAIGPTLRRLSQAGKIRPSPSGFGWVKGSA